VAGEPGAGRSGRHGGPHERQAERLRRIALGTATQAGYLCLALLLGSFYINGTAWLYQTALLEKHRQGTAGRDEWTTVTIPGGLVEGLETIIFYCLFLLLVGLFPWLSCAMAALVVITSGQRLWRAATQDH